jgi:NitT/TauT family transport system permease protein
MLAAMIASLIFTVTYGTLAAKSRRAELVPVPLLDILQSVPVLGYISFTVAFFMSLFPGRVAGAESRGYFRDLYEPSLEHDLQLLPVAAHCTS